MFFIRYKLIFQSIHKFLFSFQINDVPLGGATAFPVLRLAVPPIKGSLVVWYNYHKSVQPDYRTWHAGCPVLQGSKWSKFSKVIEEYNVNF